MESNAIEAANRVEITARLIRLGYRVYRPEADCGGEDLALRTPSGKLLAVQLKSRPTVNWERYGKDKSIWMLFPAPKGDFNSGRKWFLVPHNRFYEWLRAEHGDTTSIKKGVWHETRISSKLDKFLKKYSLSTRLEGVSSSPIL